MNRNRTYRAAGALALAASTVIAAPAASAQAQDDAHAQTQASSTSRSSSQGGVDAIGLTGLGAAIASGAGLVYLQRERRNDKVHNSRRR